MRHGEDGLFLEVWILTFTVGVANLNMTVRRNDPGAAGVMKWCGTSLAARLVTEVWPDCYRLDIFELYAH